MLRYEQDLIEEKTMRYVFLHGLWSLPDMDVSAMRLKILTGLPDGTDAACMLLSRGRKTNTLADQNSAGIGVATVG